MGRRKPAKGRERFLGLLVILLLSFIFTQLFDFKRIEVSTNLNQSDVNASVQATERRAPPDVAWDFPPEWLANIHDSMYHFTKDEKVSISSSGLNKAYDSLRHGLFIRVENNTAFAKAKTVYGTPWETDFDAGLVSTFFCRMYFVICSLDLDTDIDFIYSHADEPVGYSHKPYPAFSWVKSDTSTDLLVPYGETWGGPLRHRDKHCKTDINDTLWDERIHKGVWRGSNTGVRTNVDWKSAPRAQLVTICNTFPDICDAGFTQYVNGRLDQIQEMKNTLGIVDMLHSEEQDRFKYAIVPDGNSAPSSRMKSHLESESLTMKQKSIFKEFFYDSLVPYVHYLPLSENFDDLVEKITWARKNDQFVRDMVRHARELACKWFNSNTIHSYLMSVFKEYVKRFNGIQATNIKTSDMIRIKINSLEELEKTCALSRYDFKDKSCRILTAP